MAYMEDWEVNKYERLIPNRLKAIFWKRFVDDCLLVYTGSEKDFEDLLTLLNTLDHCIQFTCERSKPGSEFNLDHNAVEAIPFLDLLVIRYLDEESNSLSNKLAIYRKACQSSQYIHFYSAQPVSTKRAVIRSIFLRAYRYCDNLFLEGELRRIHEDFGRLGYKKRFIDKARISAKQGRDHEIRIRNEAEPPRQPRERKEFTLVIPYHRRTKGLQRLGHERGIDVVFSSRDSLGSRITRKNQHRTEGGVYMLPCKQQNCDKIYVGQSQDIPERMDQHRNAVRGVTSLQKTAVARHCHSGHRTMDPDNHAVPYRSSILRRRLMVETSLITLCNTVANTKASSNNTDMDTIGPVLLSASNINWKEVQKMQPNFNPLYVPKNARALFRNNHVPLEDPPRKLSRL